MATVGRTLFRFGGALLLGASATAIDDPGVLFAPSVAPRSTIAVVVAARDMPEGAVIDAEWLAVAQWPRGTQPAGSYGSVDSVADRVTREPIYKGQPIVPARLAPPGTGPGVEVKITPGKRAYGIRINDVASLAGLVQPNSRVDIMVIIDDRHHKKPVAKLFMEDVRVLAIGALTQRSRNEAQTHFAVASLEVTPEQAERLAVAAAQGELKLVLRGYGDPASPPASRLDRMSVIVPRPACDPPAGRQIVRDLLRRTCSSELTFRKDSAAAVVIPRR